MIRTILFEERTSFRKLPVNYKVEDAPYFQSEFQRQINASERCELTQSNVTEDGVVFRNFHMYRESLLNMGRGKRFGIKYILKTYLKLKRIKYNNPVIVAYNQMGGSYFHWITETLPRLYTVMDDLAESTLLLPERYNQMQLETLTPFKIKGIYWLKQQHYVTVKELILPTHTAHTGNYNEELICRIRDLYTNNLNSTLEFGERIYISRRKASRRKVINEEQVVDLLTRFGFNAICFEDFSFADQVSIANHARIIISIHGAGLTNIIFMKPRGFVLELRRKGDWHNLCYYSLSSALDLNYLYQFCEPTQPNATTFDADLLVDVKELANNLKFII